MSTRPIPTDAFTRELIRIDELIAAGKLPQAAVSLNAARRKKPMDPRVFLVGMRLARAARNPQGELDAARRAVELNPDWPVSAMELAFVLSRQQQHTEAIAQAGKAIALSPNELELLTRGVAVASDAADYARGIEWVRRALALAPQAQELHYALAQFLLKTEKFEEAQALFEQLAQEVPDSLGVRMGLIMCARALKNTELERSQVDLLLAADPGNTDYQYEHAIAYGEIPKTQPESTVSRLFDNYAERFDMHLVGGLKYRVPEMVAKRLVELHPDRRFNLLDLGCGTGLLSVFLGPIQGHAIGVDLSEKMLEQAARHGLYSRLHNVNVLDALRETPSDHYEAIACNDVLIYVGDLGEVIPNAWRILKPGGHFIFSCETAGEDEDDMVLRPKSNRYAHKASYVERLCRQAGFDDVQIEHLEQLRIEGGEPLPGFLVVARKPA